MINHHTHYKQINLRCSLYVSSTVWNSFCCLLKNCDEIQPIFLLTYPEYSWLIKYGCPILTLYLIVFLINVSSFSWETPVCPTEKSKISSSSSGCFHSTTLSLFVAKTTLSNKMSITFWRKLPCFSRSGVGKKSAIAPNALLKWIRAVMNWVYMVLAYGPNALSILLPYYPIRMPLANTFSLINWISYPQTH